MLIFLIYLYRLTMIPTEVTTGKCLLKCIGKFRGLQTGKITELQGQVWEVMLPEVKRYFKTTAVRTLMLFL